MSQGAGRKLHPKRAAKPDAKRPKHQKKDWDPLVKEAWDQGWWVERRRKYIYCYALDENESIVKVPMTPSGSRTMNNKRRDFRAAGLRL
jgi:hypothetical protein